MYFSPFVKGQFQVFSRKRYLIPFIILLLSAAQYSYCGMAIALDSFLVEPLVDSPGKTVGSDFNGDGIHDILMGAFRNNDGPGANNAGAVYLVFGSDSLSATINTDGLGPNVTILGKANDDRLGTSLGGGRSNPGP